MDAKKKKGIWIAIAIIALIIIIAAVLINGEENPAVDNTNTEESNNDGINENINSIDNQQDESGENTDSTY